MSLINETKGFFIVPSMRPLDRNSGCHHYIRQFAPKTLMSARPVLKISN
jgi:hypothetical protein